MVNEESLFYAKLATVAIAFAGKALFRHQAFANIKLLRLSPLAIFDPGFWWNWPFLVLQNLCTVSEFNILVDHLGLTIHK